MKVAIIKWEIMKIFLSKIYTFLNENKRKSKNENNQIPFSLTTLSPYKSKWKIWMVVSLYSDYLKMRLSE